MRFLLNKHSFSEKLCVTYRPPCRTSGDPVFYSYPSYLYGTTRHSGHQVHGTLCHASDHLVIYCKCYRSEIVLFTLRHFLCYTPSCFFQGFPGPGISTSKLAGLHAYIAPAPAFKTWPRPNYLFKSQQSTKKFYVVSSI